MTNNSPVFWEANGLSLHTHAWSVKSFGGRRFFSAPRRGEDIEIPFRRGRIHVPKTREPQLYDINMWVLPLDEDGSRSATLTIEQAAHRNWRKLVQFLDIDGQFPLVKRWYDGSSVKSATALAEFLEGDGPNTDDGQSFYASLTLMLADPYFYQPVAGQPVGTIEVEGEVPTDHVVITLSGGTNPRVSLPSGNWIQFNGSVGGTPVVIDALNGTAKQGSQFVNGLVTRSNLFPKWLELKPGTQNLTYSGGGTATIRYDAAYR